MTTFSDPTAQGSILCHVWRSFEEVVARRTASIEREFGRQQVWSVAIHWPYLAHTFIPTQLPPSLWCKRTKSIAFHLHRYFCLKYLSGCYLTFPDEGEEADNFELSHGRMGRKNALLERSCVSTETKRCSSRKEFLVVMAALRESYRGLTW